MTKSFRAKLKRWNKNYFNSVFSDTIRAVEQGDKMSETNAKLRNGLDEATADFAFGIIAILDEEHGDPRMENLVAKYQDEE